MELKSWHIAASGTALQFLANLFYSGSASQSIPWAGIVFSALFYFDRHQRFVLENAIAGAFFAFFGNSPIAGASLLVAGYHARRALKKEALRAERETVSTLSHVTNDASKLALLAGLPWYVIGLGAIYFTGGELAAFGLFIIALPLILANALKDKNFGFVGMLICNGLGIFELGLSVLAAYNAISGGPTDIDLLISACFLFSGVCYLVAGRNIRTPPSSAANKKWPFAPLRPIPRWDPRKIRMF